jgi:hypothetical protein
MKYTVKGNSISSESVYKISHTWVDVLIFYVVLFGAVYLAWCNFALDPMKGQLLILYKSRESATEFLAMIKWPSRKKAWAVYWKSEITFVVKDEKGKEQSQENSYFLWRHGDFFYKEFILSDQKVNSV